MISATVDRKNQSLRDYALDRMARVYSVAIPALIFSFALSVVFHAQLIEVAKIICSFFFLGQVGLEQIPPFYNEPFWSLCYEVMYYIGFGCFMFLKGSTRILFLILFLLVAGPKVLLLMPCWLLGVFIYHCRDKIILNSKQALLVALLIPVGLAFFFHKMQFDDNTTKFTKAFLGSYHPLLGFSNGFLIDYVKAIIIAIHLYAIRFVIIRWHKSLETFITKAASMSFTLYLMHMPMVLLIFNLTSRGSRGLLIFLVAAIGIPLFCYFISLFTEARRPQLRKHLDAWLPNKA